MLYDILRLESNACVMLNEVNYRCLKNVQKVQVSFEWHFY